MSLEENKALIYKLAEAFNTKNDAVIDELIAPDFVDHAMQLKGRVAFGRGHLAGDHKFTGFKRFFECSRRWTVLSLT